MSHHHPMDDIAPLAGRFDLYGAVHKGLRRAQCDILGRLGATDFSSPADSAPVLADLRSLLFLAAAHVEHEDREIHTVLHARSASTETIDDQHDDHREAFATLARLIDDIDHASGAGKIAAGRRLYLAFAAYIAEDFAHMHEEETVTAPTLWSLLSDQDLAGIEMRIVGSMPPEKNMAFMRIMLPAMNPQERLGLLRAMKAAAPPEAFNAVIEFAARPNLSKQSFNALAAGLGIAA